MLDTVCRDEERVLPVNSDHRDDHHCDDQRRADWPQESKSEQQSGNEFRQPQRCREKSTGTKTAALQPAARTRDPVTAKPAKQFLRSVGGEDQAEDDSENEESDVEKLNVDGVRGHMTTPRKSMINA